MGKRVFPLLNVPVPRLLREAVQAAMAKKVPRPMPRRSLIEGVPLVFRSSVGDGSAGFNQDALSTAAQHFEEASVKGVLATAGVQVEKHTWPRRDEERQRLAFAAVLLHRVVLRRIDLACHVGIGEVRPRGRHFLPEVRVTVVTQDDIAHPRHNVERREDAQVALAFDLAFFASTHAVISRSQIDHVSTHVDLRSTRVDIGSI